MIRHTSFKHGWFYHYRVHIPKAQNLLSSFSSLYDYLDDMFENCPHEYFTTGPRSSKLQLELPIDITPIPGHEMCSAAKFGLDHGRFKTAHSNVQVTMLENDAKTIAVELPLWIMPEENQFLAKLLQSEHPLTGHIDLITVEQGKIWIWDYKPNAQKEKYAHIQTYVYAVMLSARTGISLDNFRCGYFDEQDCYVFAPKEHLLVPELIIE